ncbi:cation:proton antiporter [Sutcliffiella cohnii]
MLTLLLGLLIILITTRISGSLVIKIGQPRVVGEMIAGIILGPTILGSIFLDLHRDFIDEIREPLYFFSQLGLGFYMFLIGLEMDKKTLIRKNIKQGSIIATAGILFMFLISFHIAWVFYDSLEASAVSKFNFSFFVACALSLTAFPMLAKILEERGYTKEKFGSISIIAASMDDALAWILMALLMSLVSSNNPYNLLYILLKLGLFILVMFKIVRPLLNYISDRNLNEASLSYVILTVIFGMLCTEYIGIHSIFGAFIAGVIMPENLRSYIERSIRNFVNVLFLPTFFVYSGLNTNLMVFNDWAIIFPALIFTTSAFLGKYVSVTLVAKMIGFNWKESSAIGALMNTRGLMILIFGQVGLDYNIIDQDIFSIFVIIAVISTASTYPLFNISFPRKNNKSIFDKKKNIANYN